MLPNFRDVAYLALLNAMAIIIRAVGESLVTLLVKHSKSRITHVICSTLHCKNN